MLSLSHSASSHLFLTLCIPFLFICLLFLWDWFPLLLNLLFLRPSSFSSILLLGVEEIFMSADQAIGQVTRSLNIEKNIYHVNKNNVQT